MDDKRCVKVCPYQYDKISFDVPRELMRKGFPLMAFSKMMMDYPDLTPFQIGFVMDSRNCFGASVRGKTGVICPHFVEPKKTRF